MITIYEKELESNLEETINITLKLKYIGPKRYQLEIKYTHPPDDQTDRYIIAAHCNQNKAIEHVVDLGRQLQEEYIIRSKIQDAERWLSSIDPAEVLTDLNISYIKEES